MLENYQVFNELICNEQLKIELQKAKEKPRSASITVSKKRINVYKKLQKLSSKHDLQFKSIASNNVGDNFETVVNALLNNGIGSKATSGKVDIRLYNNNYDLKLSLDSSDSIASELNFKDDVLLVTIKDDNFIVRELDLDSQKELLNECNKGIKTFVKKDRKGYRLKPKALKHRLSKVTDITLLLERLLNN